MEKHLLVLVRENPKHLKLTANVRKHSHIATLRGKLEVKIKVFHMVKIFLTSHSTRKVTTKQRISKIHLNIH